MTFIDVILFKLSKYAAVYGIYMIIFVSVHESCAHELKKYDWFSL